MASASCGASDPPLLEGSPRCSLRTSAPTTDEARLSARRMKNDIAASPFARSSALFVLFVSTSQRSAVPQAFRSSTACRRWCPDQRIGSRSESREAIFQSIIRQVFEDRKTGRERVEPGGTLLTWPTPNRTPQKGWVSRKLLLPPTTTILPHPSPKR